MRKILEALMTGLVIMNTFWGATALLILIRDFNSDNGGQTLLLGLVLTIVMAFHLGYVIVRFENFSERLVYLFTKELGK